MDPAVFLTNSVVQIVPNQLDDPMCSNLLCGASKHLHDSMCFDFLCGAAISPVQEDDECEAHAAFLVESEGFGVVDSGATTSFGSVEGAEALFSKIHENDTRIPDVDPCGGGSFNLKTVLRLWLHHCPDSQFEMRLLVIFVSLCTCSLIKQNRPHWCWAWIFSRNTVVL